MNKLMKALQEEKNTKIAAMEEMLTRSVEEFDAEKVEEMKRDIEAINTKIETIKGADEMVRTVDKIETKVVDDAKTEETRAIEKQEELFLKAISGDTEAFRAMGVNGSDAIIPSTIAKDIIKEIETISAIYSNVRKFPVKGKLSFALEDTTSDEITVSYVDDNVATPESKAAFKSQAIEDFQIRGLVRISKSLIGKSQFDLRTYVIQKIASAYAKFIENEIFNGTKAVGKIQGLVTLPADRTVNVPLAGKDLSIDYLMDLESKVPTSLRTTGCAFYMNPTTVRKLRSIKYATGENALQKDLHSKFSYNLLGYTIHESDNVDANTIFFGDASGYYCKEVQGMAIQTLLEKYAEYNQIGFHSVAELGGAPVELQKLAVLKIAMTLS